MRRRIVLLIGVGLALTLTGCPRQTTITGVTITPDQLQLDVGATATLSAHVHGLGRPSQAVAWTSDRTSVATVTASGVVTGVAEGHATITATCAADPAHAASAAVQVTREDQGSDPMPAAELSITGVPERPCVGQPFTLLAHVEYEEWFSPDWIAWTVTAAGAAPRRQSGPRLELLIDRESDLVIEAVFTDRERQSVTESVRLRIEHCVIANPDTVVVHTGHATFAEYTLVIDVLHNDISSAGEALSIASIELPAPGHGPFPRASIVTLAESGREAIRYTGGPSGEFRYVVSDESDRRDTGTVTIQPEDAGMRRERFFEYPAAIDCSYLPWEGRPLPCCINERDDIAWNFGTDFPSEPPFEPRTWRARVSYHDGRQVDLGTLGGEHSVAHGLNDHGVVVGASSTATGAGHAFRWSPETGMVDLGTAGGRNSIALAVSNQGHVVGFSERPDGSVRAIAWTRDGAVIDVGAAFGDDALSWATGVVDSVRWGPVVVGVVWRPAGVPQPSGGFMWIDANRDGVARQDEITWLGDLGEGPSSVIAVNATLQVIGHAALDGQLRGFVWSHASGEMVALEAPAGSRTQLSGINRHGRVVGTLEREDGMMAGVIWESGRLVEPRELLPAGEILAQLVDVNDRGNLLGNAFDVGTACSHPYRFVSE